MMTDAPRTENESVHSTESERKGPEKARRKAHHKVKTGCKACKTRRQKCGEQKPICNGCIRHSTECVYQPTDEHKSRSPLSASSSLSRNLGPLPPSNGLNLDDLELLHQFMTSTCVATSQHPQATQQRQTNLPGMARAHPFVMRGILAQAALHLSWLRPAQKAHYVLLAANHHSIALPDFRSTMQNVDMNNYESLIVYSKGLVWCAFAGYEGFATRSSATEGSHEVDWLPDWFHLLHGSCLIVNSCVRLIQPDQYFLPPPLEDTTEFWASAQGLRVASFRTELESVTDSLVCTRVVAALEEAFVRASFKHHNTPLRNAANAWVGMLPNEYLIALKMEEPWALVILAHFCILVHWSETQWFMKGHATKLLQSVTRRLPQSWLGFVKWPCEELGI